MKQYVLFRAQQVKALGCVGNLLEVAEELKGCPVKLSWRVRCGRIGVGT